MRIILFASPGILGPYVLSTLIHLKETIVAVVMPTAQYSTPSEELVSLAQAAGADILQPKILRESTFVEQLKKYNADLIIVATFDKKISREIIELPKLGAVNIHSSYLPSYRGACPEFWVIQKGETETGVTFHYLNEEFDGGDIILQEKIPIGKDATVGMVVYSIASVSSRLLVQFIGECRKGNLLKGTPQDDTQSSQAPLVQANELQIYWDLNVTDIYNLVRAANPIGGAWTIFRGFQLKVWHVSAFECQVQDMLPIEQDKPGAICVLPDIKKVCVRAHNGFVELKVVQLAYYYIVDGWSFVEKAYVKQGELLQSSFAVRS